jgi:hypothetical protein
MTRKTTDPSSPLYQADVLGTGLAPNDSMIADNVNVALTPDYAQTDPQVDAGVDTPMVPAPLAGTIANHVDISEADYNTLADRNYTMLGDN